jgi:hypothetical protein
MALTLRLVILMTSSRVFLQFLQLLTTTSQPSKFVGIGSILIRLEDWKGHTSDVILLGADLDLSFGDILEYNLIKVSSGELSLSERESSFLHHVSHQCFSLKESELTFSGSDEYAILSDLDDFAQNHTESHLQCVGLLLQQPMSLMSSCQTSFHQHLSSAKMEK